MVACDDRQALPRGWTSSRIDRLLRFEEALQGPRSMPPRQLAVVLNEARERWGRGIHGMG